MIMGLGETVDPAHTDIPIIVCCFVSGICESVAFTAASVFVAMQTGNTLFLAIGAAHLPYGDKYLWLRAFIVLIAFWMGCFVFSKTRHFRPLSRATLLVSFLIQSLCIFIAAALAQSNAVPAFSFTKLGTAELVEAMEHDKQNLLVLLPLSFLAFQFGGQIVASRQLNFNEVPTNVLTSVYCDLLSDPNILARVNPKRNRRFAAIVLLIAGGICGGWIQRSQAGMSGALWVAGAIKMIVALSWAFWKGKSS